MPIRVNADDLMQIVDLLPDVLFRCVKREDGKIIWTLNEGGLAREFGLLTHQIEGKTLEELFEGGASDAIKDHFYGAFEGKTETFVNPLMGRHFKHYPQQVYDKDGNIEAVVGYITEVTDLIHTEQRLLRANRDLKGFAHAIIHDLGNPLSALAIQMAAFEKLYLGDLPDEAQEKLDRMVRQVKRLQQISDDVLHLAHVNEGDLERQEFDVSAMVQDLAEAHGRLDANRSVEWDIQPGIQLDADRRLTRILLENLIGNAWKFTENQSPSLIRFYQEEDFAGTWLCVSDNGPGFDPSDAKRIFQPFERAHADVPGSGIGLGTVQRIVDRHAGAIEAIGVPGEGATFRFKMN